MSVYQPRDSKGKLKSPYWAYDFKIKVKGRDSQRFYGSTGQKTKQAAQRHETRLKELAALGQLSCDMTISEACWKYWNEVSAKQRSADDTATTLEYLCTYLGKDKRIVDVTGDDIAQAATQRFRTPIHRHQVIKGVKVLAPTKHMPTPSTVNRQIIEPIKRVLNRAKRVWKLPIDLDAFDWPSIAFEEAAGRTRQLSVEEEERLWLSLREDYHPIMELYIISGRRRSDWIGLKKAHVDRTAGTARFPTRKRKEQGEITVYLTPRELEIIKQEWDKSPADCEFVFTYVVRKARTIGKERKLVGECHAITVSGFRKVTDEAFEAAGLDNFKRHDLRHTFASRFRREGGDMKALQGAMDHQHASSTMRYVHVNTGELIDLKSRVTVNRKKTSSTGIVPEIVKVDFSKPDKSAIKISKIDDNCKVKKA